MTAAADAWADAVGRISGRVSSIKSDEYGEEHALAVAGVLTQVRAILADELRRAHQAERDAS